MEQKVTRMKELKKKPNPPKTGSAPQEPRAKRGRKRAATKEPKTPAGRGATRLRNSVNAMVDKQSDAIARALIKKTCAGNATIARLLVGISGADKAPPETRKKKKKSKWSTYIQNLANEPEHQGPWEDEVNDHDASRLPPSDYDLRGKVI